MDHNGERIKTLERLNVSYILENEQLRTTNRKLQNQLKDLNNEIKSLQTLVNKLFTAKRNEIIDVKMNKGDTGVEEKNVESVSDEVLVVEKGTDEIKSIRNLKSLYDRDDKAKSMKKIKVDFPIKTNNNNNNNNRNRNLNKSHQSMFSKVSRFFSSKSPKVSSPKRNDNKRLMLFEKKQNNSLFYSGNNRVMDAGEIDESLNLRICEFKDWKYADIFLWSSMIDTVNIARKFTSFAINSFEELQDYVENNQNRKKLFFNVPENEEKIFLIHYELMKKFKYFDNMFIKFVDKISKKKSLQLYNLDYEQILLFLNEIFIKDIGEIKSLTVVLFNVINKKLNLSERLNNVKENQKIQEESISIALDFPFQVGLMINNQILLFWNDDEIISSIAFSNNNLVLEICKIGSNSIDEFSIMKIINEFNFEKRYSHRHCNSFHFVQRIVDEYNMIKKEKYDDLMKEIQSNGVCFLNNLEVDIGDYIILH